MYIKNICVYLYQNKEIMKNIVLLPSNEKTRLVRVFTDALRENFVLKLDTEVNDSFKEYVNLYIISYDDNLELGGYHFNSKYGDELQKTNQRDIDSRKYWEAVDYYISKILLTTDLELVKDGIQEVPESFLNWFLENPSCEYVELKQEKLHPGEVMDDSYPKDFLDYQIVFQNGESLIDAANEYAKNDYTKSYDFSSDTLIEAFTEGANWQSQRMYSKEELKNIAIWAFGFYRRNDLSDDELEVEFNRILNKKLLKK